MMKADQIRRGESGAALMTVLVATLLLGTACIALLTAVSAGSQNQTDALSEAKAYWAAESGLQATINVLRNTANLDYNGAVADPDLSTWLTYDANGKVVMNSEAAYSVTVMDPDATLPYMFYTTGSFNTTATSGVTLSNGTTPPKICFPDCNAGTLDRTEVSFTGVGSTTQGTNTSRLGTFSVTKVGAGYDIPAGVTFRIEFEMTSPRTDINRTIRGKIPASSANANVGITFDSQVYELVGSDIELCSAGYVPSTLPPNACPNVSYSLASGQSAEVFAAITPTEPYRLKVTSIGYGPNSSQKKLEGVIIKDLLNGLPTTSALTMVGPGASVVFQPGPGTPTYCGVDPDIDPGETIPNNPTCVPDPNAPTAPAIGVSDQTALDTVNGSLGNTAVIPAPDIITDGPDWLSSAPELNNYLYGPDGLKARAQQSGKYIPDTNGAGVTDLDNYMPVGNFDDGSGLTFCEGSCSVGPRSGGGILVVTGNFDYNGNFNFRGTIIVVGNMHRDGGGSGVILGSVIIAPYNLANPSAGFLSPNFTTTGGGSSDIIYNGAATAFDGTSAVTDLMIGVAEK